MDEGCAGLVVILIVIGLILAAVYLVIVVIGYTLAYIGLTVLLFFDYFATAFTWVGISSPMGGWLLLGCLIGGTIGLAKGLKKAGRKSDAWKVYVGAGLLTLLLLLGSYSTASSVNGAEIPGSVSGFSIQQPANSGPTNFISIINAKVTTLRFYESAEWTKLEGQRQYQTRFAASKSRYICWELAYSYPPPGRLVKFNVDAVYYRPDNTVLARQTMDGDVQSDWTESYTGYSYGAKKPGTWKVGIYRVDLFVSGTKIATGTFEVY
jgi:hypothetical protein